MSEIAGVKFDDKKPRWSLMPFSVISEIVKVLDFGAKKYGVNNWQHLAEPKERYFSALIRHLEAWQRGEKTDPESGLSHLAHAGCNLVFLIWFERK